MLEMESLERALTELGRDLDYPEAPGLERAVAERLRAEPTPLRRHRRRRVRRLAALAAAAVMLIGGAAVAARFALRGVEIVEVPSPPVVTAPPGPNLALGRPATLAEARAAVPYEVRVPAALGAADGIFVNTDAPGQPVAMTYEPRAGLSPDPRTGLGLLFTQFRGETDTALIEKLLGPDTTVQQVSVGGAPGLWIEGAPHAIGYRDAEGRVFEDSVRLAGNVLLWQEGEVTYRIEGHLSRDEAIRIAESLR